MCHATTAEGEPKKEIVDLSLSPSLVQRPPKTGSLKRHSSFDSLSTPEHSFSRHPATFCSRSIGSTSPPSLTRSPPSPPPFSLTTFSPKPSPTTIIFTITVTEPPVTHTRNVLITVQATATVLSLSLITETFTETIDRTTMLPPTTHTETKLINSTEIATAITQTETVTATTPTPSSTGAHFQSKF
ncbi:uncharacterized protein BT62DRAFT_277460 [Guyanagaster necrorhizus]|uniref:Uncharacterized protein n=1 Tax=Guyanagaster necrorhizus TaxID=856835 RepID=A0A9P7W699_9AGAR|nr:uncharacterized protein BT62DRAFT_277460 [Guyanagaster necrorhizus MCA 3950]KAG7452036.1 hypothetical protein BT62DRAFT_277460 [Guyanagaster necrorhizus MCA 3950]